MSSDPIERMVGQLVRAHRDAVEAACERMLTDPRGRGVLVVEDWTNALTMTDDGTLRVAVMVDLSPDVPFGEIHYRRSARDLL